ncbi:MAG: flavodoxin-dependent (E)-4-hydroxy-3-methylbut-2-enyl-diphosphate synthase [Oscillospiraceae bacterium]|jgi:(E)-4-hydroxy-3-methylbut-2-enyl-diphosphate synthase
MKREETKVLHVGPIAVGGDAPVSVQSMCSTKTSDVEATLAQIAALEAAGCDIVRLAVPDAAAAKALPAIRRGTKLPLVADIHFDYKLALAAADAGFDAIRINPGNIGSNENVRAVADACRQNGVPIRVGVNSGSIPKDLLEKYGATPEALVQSALRHIHILEELDFGDICVSLKSSSVPYTVAAYRRMAEAVSYPLHLGVTETGTPYMGVIKSAAGIGALLLDGIGSTIRVSLTAEPVEEVKAGIALLKAVGLRRDGVNIISCPTCGRTSIDLISLANEVERRLSPVKQPLTVAVMGCIVNGPGEAREADYGVAGGCGEGIVFRKGEIVAKVPEAALADALCDLIATEEGAEISK